MPTPMRTPRLGRTSRAGTQVPQFDLNSDPRRIGCAWRGDARGSRHGPGAGPVEARILREPPPRGRSIPRARGTGRRRWNGDGLDPRGPITTRSGNPSGSRHGAGAGSASARNPRCIRTHAQVRSGGTRGQRVAEALGEPPDAQVRGCPSGSQIGRTRSQPRDPSGCHARGGCAAGRGSPERRSRS